MDVIEFADQAWLFKVAVVLSKPPIAHGFPLIPLNLAASYFAIRGLFHRLPLAYFLGIWLVMPGVEVSIIHEMPFQPATASCVGVLRGAERGRHGWKISFIIGLSCWKFFQKSNPTIKINFLRETQWPVLSSLAKSSQEPKESTWFNMSLSVHANHQVTLITQMSFLQPEEALVPSNTAIPHCFPTAAALNVTPCWTEFYRFSKKPTVRLRYFSSCLLNYHCLNF